MDFLPVKEKYKTIFDKESRGYLLIIVLIGGQVGNYLNLKIFPTKILTLITSALVLFVAVRMGINLFK